MKNPFELVVYFPNFQSTQQTDASRSIKLPLRSSYYIPSTILPPMTRHFPLSYSPRNTIASHTRATSVQQQPKFSISLPALNALLVRCFQSRSIIKALNRFTTTTTTTSYYIRPISLSRRRRGGKLSRAQPPLLIMASRGVCVCVWYPKSPP